VNHILDGDYVKLSLFPYFLLFFLVSYLDLITYIYFTCIASSGTDDTN